MVVYNLFNCTKFDQFFKRDKFIGISFNVCTVCMCTVYVYIYVFLLNQFTTKIWNFHEVEQYCIYRKGGLLRPKIRDIFYVGDI